MTKQYVFLYLPTAIHQLKHKGNDREHIITTNGAILRLFKHYINEQRLQAKIRRLILNAIIYNE